MTRVVDLRNEPHDVYVGRPKAGRDGYFGNPVKVGHVCPVCDDVHELAGETVACHATWLARKVEQDPDYRSRVRGLHGKVLGCFCKPGPCHGDNLAAMADKLAAEEPACSWCGQAHEGGPEACRKSTVSKLKYEELRRRTEFSLLAACGRLKDHVQRGIELGSQVICVTDTATLRYAYELKNDVYKYTPDGVVEQRPIYGTIFNIVADHKQYGLDQDTLDLVTAGLDGRAKKKAIRDEEAKQQVNRTWDVCARALTHEGFTNLSRLTSIAWDAGCYRGIPRIDLGLLLEHHAGISISFGGGDSLVGDLIVQNRMAEAVDTLLRLQEVFDGRMFLEIMPHPGAINKRVNRAFVRISERLGIPLIAVNDVHYVRDVDTDAHTVLLCIAAKTTMEDPDHPQSPPGYHLRTGDEMFAAFQENHPWLDEDIVIEAIERTVAVATMHTHKMEIDRFKALVPVVPHKSKDDLSELRRLCEEGWAWRDIEGRAKARRVPVSEYRERLEVELGPEGCAKFPAYFLLVRDLIQWSRDQGIMTGPGRGSAAGSLVCFLLGITSLDPLEHCLLFERFISPSRIDMPDIDMDFEDVRREEVITYLHETYGYDKCSLIATIGRLKGKSALKDVSRVLGVPFGRVNDVTNSIVERSSGDERASQTVEDSFKEFKVCRDFDHDFPQVLPLVMKLEGHAKQVGVHAAGVITSPVPLPDVVPIETHMRDGHVTKLAAYDMYGVGAMGLLKLDVLGLRTLTVLNDARKAVLERHGIDVDMETLPLDDAAVLKKFTDHEYVGIFQYDSTGAHAACEGITFDHFEDIVALVALNRPGTMRSGLATEYRKRKMDPSAIKSVHPIYDDICSDTLGVLVYQEHVTRIFVQMAGYSPGTADSLRKVIAKKIGDETLKKEREAFVAGCRARGVDEELASKIISDITFFGSYGFNKSHSAAYGVIAYWQMWFKAHYPAELMWALMKNEPDRAEITRFAKEAKRLGIQVLPPHINFSGQTFTLDDGGNIRSSLVDVKNVGATAVAAIEAAQPFSSIVDFFERTTGRAINSRVLVSLIKAGAMRDLLPNTRVALETATEKGGWLDIARKKRSGWEEKLRDAVRESASQPDYEPEDLLYMAGEVSPLGGGKHPMEVYRSLINGEMKRVPFLALDDEFFWEYKMPIIAGVMIDIKYNQVGDFETVEPDEETKRRMGWGRRYANINIEDESGVQVRVKLPPEIFEDFREIVDQGIGTCMAARLSTNKGFKSARAIYLVDLETMRSKGRVGLAYEGWERCVSANHPAAAALLPGDVTSWKSCAGRKVPFNAVGVIVHRKDIITKNGDDMCFIGLELPDHYCLDIVVFPDQFSDWGNKLKVGRIVRLALKNDKKATVLLEDGVLSTHGYVTKPA